MPTNDAAVVAVFVAVVVVVVVAVVAVVVVAVVAVVVVDAHFAARSKVLQLQL